MMQLERFSEMSVKRAIYLSRTVSNWQRDRGTIGSAETLAHVVGNNQMERDFIVAYAEENENG